MRIMRVILITAVFLLAVAGGAMMQAYAAPEHDTVTAAGSSKSVSNSSYSRLQADPDLTVVVYSGDTLWSIAKQYAPKGTDVRNYIQKLTKVNGLKSSSIFEGQVLRLPAR